MPIGPRDKPSPLILHINSTTNAPAKIAEASAIYVTTVSAVTVSATNYLGLNFTGAGTPAGPDVGLVQYYANPTDFGSDPTFKFTPGTKTLSVSNVSSTNSESVVANVGVLTANTILNPVILVSTKVSAAYGNISELSSVIVSATTYKNLPTSSLSGLADVQFTNPSNGQSLVWSSTRWVASSVAGGAGTSNHADLIGLASNDHPQYVLSSTNANLSSLVSNIQTSAGQLSSTLANHLASAVHWDLTTLNSNYLNSSGDTANAGFYLQSVSAATVSATDYLNLPSSTIRWLNAYNTEVVRKYVKNSTGTSIPKGTPVTITGATGDNSLITPLSSVNTHIPEAIGLSNHVFGLAESEILNDNFGYIITEGMLSGTGGQGSINTSLFNPGDILYVSSNGLLSNVRPTPPYESHPVGYVVRSHATVGSIYVKIETVPEINDIVGFNLTSSLINGDLITYDLTTSTFVNKQSVTVSGQVRSGSVSATTYLNLPQANASSLNGFNIDLPIAPEQYSILAYEGASWQSTNTPRFISVSATSYLNLPTSSLSGLADVRVTSTPSNGQSLVWSSTKWIASSIAGGPGATDHGALTGLEDNDHPQYVLSSTNATLSSLVSNIQTSTVNLSSTVGNLQTSTLNLSSLLGTHISSAVHWDLTTLNSNYINSSGDSSNNSFYFGTLSATTFSATNYKNLPTSSLSGMLDVSVVSPSGGQALIYSSSVNKWYPGYTIYQRNTAPDSSIGVNGDIYFQYTNTNEIIALSGLTDTEITPPITNGQSLVWNSGLNKWAPSALPLPVGSNYNFQFYKDSNLSSTSSFVWNPSDYGGSLSATVPFSSSKWGYFSETVGVGQGIILYGNGGGQTAYIKNGPAGTTAASANALITPSVSATTVSATTYLNLAPNSNNYEFEFYNNGQLSSTNKFVWNPNLYGGTVSATAPINSNIWCYFDGTLGTGQGVILYGNGGGGTGYIKNGPVGTTAVSANNFITSSVSAAIVSSTTYKNTPAEIGIACSDETTNIVSSTSPSATFRMPYAMTLTEVRGNVNTSAAVSAIIVDIQHNGASVFTTNKLRINANEYTSKAAGTTQPNITTTSLTDDAEMKVIINQTGTTSPGKGLKIWLIGRRA